MLRRDKKESGKDQAKSGDITDERPPAVFRHFLYLDAEEVLNALSAVQGGAVEEAVDEIIRSGEGNLGLSIAVGGQGITLGGKKASQVKRSIRRRQTLHAAIAALLYTLQPRIRELSNQHPNGTLGKPPNRIEENELVQFDCELCHSRSRAVRSAYEDERNAREKRNWFERLFARDNGDEKVDLERSAGVGKTFVALASPSASQGCLKFALCLQAEHLVVAPAEFSRRATVVGQVVGEPRQDEAIVLMDHPLGTTALIKPVENESSQVKIWTSGRKQLGFAELDWSTKIDARSWSKAYLLRPMCIFK